jgi:hypothetical protein
MNYPINNVSTNCLEIGLYRGNFKAYWCNMTHSNYVNLKGPCIHNYFCDSDNDFFICQKSNLNFNSI